MRRNNNHWKLWILLYIVFVLSIAGLVQIGEKVTNKAFAHTLAVVSPIPSITPTPIVIYKFTENQDTWIGKYAEKYATKHKNASYLRYQLHLADIARKLGISHNSTVHEVLETTDAVSSVELAEPETHEVEETPKTVTDPEFGTLSRVDITMLAAAIRMHRHTLEPIAEQRGVKLVEESILEGLAELRGDEPIADFSKMTGEERNRWINEYRIKALERLREMTEAPDFDRTMERIYEQNPDVWCLIFNLSEMDKVKVENGTGIKQGITFLKDLLANPDARRKGFRVIPEPQPAPPTPEPRRVDVATVQAEAVVLFDARVVTPQEQVEAVTVDAQVPVEPIVEPVVEIPVQVTPVAQPVPVIPRAPEPEPKPKALEVRDPDIRARVNQYLDQIFEHPELHQPASPGMATRAFPRLKQRTVDALVEARYVPTETGKKADQERFDPTGVATLLYLYDHGDNLTGRLKKQVQEIVAEELKKRQQRS